MGRIIDHIVYAVPDLDAACAQLEALLGVAPVFGGYHHTQGTQNALLNLGDGCYLEILAADPNNKAVDPPRWMGVDLISEPTLTRWAIKSQNLATDSAILREYHSLMGKRSGGQRQTASGSLLRWEMILPLAEPAVEVAPFMVDWQASESHPCDALPQACRLLELQIEHPHPEKIKEVFRGLDIALEIKQATRPRILATIDSPKGRVLL